VQPPEPESLQVPGVPLATQAPATHDAPLAHWLSSLQGVLQTVPSQARPAQEISSGAGQAPVPAQTAAAVATPSWQAGARHAVAPLG
jgi:hypothetical protein